MPEDIVQTFADGEYRTVVTNEDIVVYRVFGGNADAGGSFTTTTQAVNRIQAKVDNALLPEWKNTRMYEAKIVVPKGTTLNIGKVGEQIIKETGTVLTGSNDQILLPLGWNLEWIQEIQIVPN